MSRCCRLSAPLNRAKFPDPLPDLAAAFSSAVVGVVMSEDRAKSQPSLLLGWKGCFRTEELLVMLLPTLTLITFEGLTMVELVVTALLLLTALLEVFLILLVRSSPE